MSSDILLVKSVATSFQILGCLCDLCKAARLLNASLTWSWTWDPLGTKHGNYYSCDWCLLRRESIKTFALAGSIWPERLRIRQEPTSAHKKGDRLRQTRCRGRQSSFWFLACHIFCDFGARRRAFGPVNPDGDKCCDSEWPTPCRQNKHVPYAAPIAKL